MDLVDAHGVGSQLAVLITALNDAAAHSNLATPIARIMICSQTLDQRRHGATERSAMFAMPPVGRLERGSRGLGGLMDTGPEPFLQPTED